MVTLTCERCGATFRRHPSKVGRFCSLGCKAGAGKLPAAPLDPQACAALVASSRWQTKPGNSGCIIWTRCSGPEGYGHIAVNGGMRLAHRVAYVAASGADVPAGLALDHLCSNPSCVNPAHLEAVANHENVARSTGRSAPRLRGEPCQLGHEYGSDNAHPADTANGWARCRECQRLRVAVLNKFVSAASRAAGLTRDNYIATRGSGIAPAVATLKAAGVKPLAVLEDAALTAALAIMPTLSALLDETQAVAC